MGAYQHTSLKSNNSPTAARHRAYCDCRHILEFLGKAKGMLGALAVNLENRAEESKMLKGESGEHGPM